MANQSTKINDSIMESKVTCLYVVGCNEFGEFGLNHTNSLKKLKNFNFYNKHITVDNVYSGNDYAVYSDQHNKHVYVAGNNEEGSCGIVDEESIIECKLIKYFTQRNININKICVNVSGLCTFWISDTMELYGNGSNNKYQLGLGDSANRNTPMLIEQLKGVRDIQCGYVFTVALCSNNLSNKITVIIIRYWSRGMMIPNEIVSIVWLFYKSNVSNVYLSGQLFESDAVNRWSRNRYNDPQKVMISNKWVGIEIFKDKNIIKIRSGFGHCLFLESNGSLWCSGDNKRGQLGLSHNESINLQTPVINQYFNAQRIMIKEIQCGCDHNLAIDSNNRAYSWGINTFGQCGDGTKQNCIYVPKLIKSLRNYNINGIDCGAYHSYIMTSDRKHFLFGRNNYNECITYDKNKEVSSPHYINTIIKKKCNGKLIKSVFLGCYNTKLILMDGTESISFQTYIDW